MTTITCGKVSGNLIGDYIEFWNDEEDTTEGNVNLADIPDLIDALRTILSENEMKREEPCVKIRFSDLLDLLKSWWQQH